MQEISAEKYAAVIVHLTLHTEKRYVSAVSDVISFATH